jgi:hypothetical protein
MNRSSFTIDTHPGGASFRTKSNLLK